jgi:hypothetical protein
MVTPNRHWLIGLYAWRVAEEASFQIKYDGPALADHTIDVNDLAPALLGLNDLIQEANHVVNNDRAAVSLRIKATEPGCFTIQAQAYQSLLDAGVDLLTGRPVTALVALLALIGFATNGKGAIEIIRRLRGKSPKAVNPIPDSGEVEIEFPDGETIRASGNVWEICRSQKARTAIHKVVKPLEKEGVEELEVIQEREVVTRITKAEQPYFLPPAEAQEQLLVTERITHVNIVSLWFSGDHKWRLSEGGNVFSASISDLDFIKKTISNEEAFRAGDFLKVRLRQTQFMTPSGLKSDWEVVEVLNHIRGDRQMPLL